MLCALDKSRLCWIKNCKLPMLRMRLLSLRVEFLFRWKNIDVLSEAKQKFISFLFCFANYEMRNSSPSWPAFSPSKNQLFSRSFRIFNWQHIVVNCGNIQGIFENSSGNTMWLNFGNFREKFPVCEQQCSLGEFWEFSGTSENFIWQLFRWILWNILWMFPVSLCFMWNI